MESQPTSSGTEIVPSKPKPQSVERLFTLAPASLGEAMQIATIIADSDFAPKDYRGKPANVMIAIQMGLDVGFKPMQALQNIAVIGGRPSIWGDGALALVQSHGVLERIVEKIEGEGEKKVATCTVRRKGYPDEIVRTFSWQDAKRANLIGKAGPWTNYENRMLQMRARSFCLRDAFSDVLMGLILAEEASDYVDAEFTSTATPAAPAESVISKLTEDQQLAIGRAFEALALSPGLRMAKTNEFLGGIGKDGDRSGLTIEDGVASLIEWCRSEYALRKGTTYTPKKDDTNGKGVKKETGAKEGTIVGSEGVAPGVTAAPVAGGTAPVVGSADVKDPPRETAKVDPPKSESEVLKETLGF